MGVELLQKLGYKPAIHHAEKYIPYLSSHDREGDDVVEQLHQQIGFPQAQRLLSDYLSGTPIASDTHQAILDQFFANLDVTPAWLNWDLIQQGIALSQRSGLTGLVVLRDYCLMGGYESAAINKPLIYTGALKKGAVKRLSETVEFWVDITGNDALKYGHIGFNSIIKTRMIHSFARINILKSTDWDSSKWGLPLNTWDMLATNLGFSLVYLVGLRRMGIHPLATEVTGLFHLWKYIGHLLGIPLEIIPETEEQAIEALYYWTMTQPTGDDDSKALAYALQEEPINAFYPRTKWGRKMMREIHLFYNRYLIGDYSCNLLKLDHTTIGHVAYLNILKNKLDNLRIHHDHHRQKRIKKGRQTHERVKQIYLRWNRPSHNS